MTRIKFKESEDSQQREYSPQELKGCKAEEKTFHVISISSKERSEKFMELIVDGYIKMYRLYESTFFGSSPATILFDYLLKTNDIKFFEIPDLHLDKRLSKYLSDNKILSDKILSCNYKNKDIPKFIQ